MNTRILLKDNTRNSNGEMYMADLDKEQVIKYLDGQVRRYTISSRHEDIDIAIALLRANVYRLAAIQCDVQLGIYLEYGTIDGDNIEVQDLGEDADQWLVTGTSDAWAAEEAVRAHYQFQTLQELNDNFGDDELSIERHTDMKWAIGGLKPSLKEEDILLTGIVEGERFAGYLIQA